MNDQHMLVASIAGERYRVATLDTYDQAYAAWTTADSALRAGTLARRDRLDPQFTARDYGYILPASRLPGNTYVAVRSVDDPGWNRAPLVELVVTRSVDGIATSQRAIAALVATGPSTLHGHTGGWLYTGGDANHRTCHLTNHQGWASWWMSNGPRHAGEVIRIDHRYHVATAIA